MFQPWNGTGESKVEIDLSVAFVQDAQRLLLSGADRSKNRNPTTVDGLQRWKHVYYSLFKFKTTGSIPQLLDNQ